MNKLTRKLCVKLTLRILIIVIVERTIDGTRASSASRFHII